MSNIREIIRRNPECLSQAERDEREARSVAMITGRYITRGNGDVVVNSRFVDAYVEMISKL
ncbi:hypothetical protein FDJ06_gp298 [Pseudomonas phage SL2]|uniref:PHIKZ058.1 n=2 Tax=Phikzvirus TaxID=680115 RepID=L7SZ06_BPDPK|nr:hypothetical protein FDJ06_gp298 [Pseudomonas phage SL2]YP_009639897.1 PHIKZ058.1 [Pseudomonas phage phiKZ]AGC26316.1 PHIKZ058.1 [Pseudomonas phage phiKZ]ATN94875.1 hypothetical protein SL2_298 [Pseudomonas phage SL2]BDR26841.1 hypothetical protein RVBP20_0820 [Pseudomonas phage sp. NK1]